MSKRQSLWALIDADIRAKAEWVYGSTSRRDRAKALVSDGTFAMIVYRLMQACQRHRLTLGAMFFNKVNVCFGGCIIGRGADFGPGFVLVHSHGVVINSSVKGGRDVKVEHQVTIGAEKGASPTLGDRVFLGAGAKVVGAVSIGNDARIGANAVVLADVPDGATAVGVPARIVRDAAGPAPGES